LDEATTPQRLKELAAERRRFWLAALEAAAGTGRGSAWNTRSCDGCMPRNRCRCDVVVAASAPWAHERQWHCRRDHQRPSLDFVSDALIDDRRFRILVVVDVIISQQSVRITVCAAEVNAIIRLPEVAVAWRQVR
jgi:hypothetical protein